MTPWSGSGATRIVTPASAQEWKVEKGDHFIVYFTDEAAARPKDILLKAEHSYNKIAGERDRDVAVRGLLDKILGLLRK